MAWYLGTPNYILNISSKKTYTITLNAGEIANYIITFAQYGKWTFYTTGNYDTIAWLYSWAEDFDESTGKPVNAHLQDWEKFDDDSGDGGNFKFKHNILYTGTEYHLYFRLYDETASGTFKLVIEPETSGGGDDDDEGETTDKPDDSGAKLTADVNGTNVTLSVSGLDSSYSGRRSTVWSVYSINASGNTDFLLQNHRVEDDSTDLLWSYTQIILTASDGISPDTQYVGVARLDYGDGSSWFAGSLIYIEFSTGDNGVEANAKLTTIRSPTGTSISAFVVGLDATYPYNDRYIVWSIDGTPESNKTYIDAYSSTSDEYIFSYLSSDKTYTIGARVWVGNKLGPYLEVKVSSAGRPDKFYWTYTKTPGGKFNLTAAEWRGLLDNITAMLAYKGLSVPSSGAGTTQLYYPYAGEPFTAAMYNQCVYQLSRLGKTIDQVAPVSPVTAAAINLLPQTINGIE